MTSTILANFLAPRDEREDGFTLIEILVVIIIIGILAAVAIPIFLNQQRTARDSATTSDVRNLATNVETALVADPEAKTFEYTVNGDGTGGTLQVGTASPVEVSQTEGTVLNVEPHPSGKGGMYYITGYNDDGQEYTDDSANARVYDSANGGIVDSVPTSVAPTP